MFHLEQSKLLLLSGLTAIVIAEFSGSAPVQAAPRRCVPIAYVVGNNDRNFRRGSLLCVGDTISLRNQQPLTVLCFANGEPVDLPNGRIPSTGCGVPKEPAPISCGPGFQLCGRARGPDGTNLQILEPYGSNTIRLRPRFRWQPVSGATEYRVRMIGNVAWSVATSQTEISYPENQPPLKPGGAYRVVVTALRGNQPLLSGEQTLNVLPQSRISRINRAVSLLQQINDDPDEVTLLGLDAIYQANGLIDESINALAARVSAGSRSPQVYRLLSERYRLVGEVDLAKQVDQSAQRLTRTSNRQEFSQF